MSGSRKRTQTILVAATVCGVLLITGYAYLRSANYRSALQATKEWARLVDFPDSAEEIEVETTGSMFTRQFTVTFTAPLDDIDEWLRQSPGPSEATPAESGATRRFEINPGGGAQGATLEVDNESGTVRINVYWS
jgi:hypothetical protein